MPSILMQGGQAHQPSGRRLWLFAGTGDGPPLAAALRRQGWRVRVSVVTAEAARAYGSHHDLELMVGALAGAACLSEQLRNAAEGGDPFTAVVDATHPFAVRIQAIVKKACAEVALPLLRLQRPRWSPEPGSSVLAHLDELSGLDLAGCRLLLAIGARQLAAAVARSPGALHHARLLPSPYSLQQAMAAALPPERVACLRPTGSGAIEAALVRRWRIEAILVRQSGGEPERRWHRLAAREGCRLLLLKRPETREEVAALSREDLLRHLAQWPPA